MADNTIIYKETLPISGGDYKFDYHSITEQIRKTDNKQSAMILSEIASLTGRICETEMKLDSRTNSLANSLSLIIESYSHIADDVNRASKAICDLDKRVSELEDYVKLHISNKFTIPMRRSTNTTTSIQNDQVETHTEPTDKQDITPVD